MSKLVAKWKPGEDPLSDEPAYFEWGDGCPATKEDFDQHKGDTRQYPEGPEGFELWIDPAVSGDVAWDATKKTWTLFLKDQSPIPLSLQNRKATDMEISWALADLDTLYRVRIHRVNTWQQPPRRLPPIPRPR